MIASEFHDDYVQGVSQVTISVPDSLTARMEQRAIQVGFANKEDYVLELVRRDCERAELEPVLESRLEGPFVPLERGWMQQVRNAAQRCG